MVAREIMGAAGHALKLARIERKTRKWRACVFGSRARERREALADFVHR